MNTTVTTFHVQEAPTESGRERVRIFGQTREVTDHGSRFPSLLVSTYENTASQNRQLTAAQQALEYLNTTLEERVRQKTECLSKRLRELRLLQGASRLLRERKLDHTTLAEIVSLMPTAWQYSEHCRARITFGKLSAESPGWRSAHWQQSVSFTTTGGVGSVDVAYVGGPPNEGASPFLAEEGEVLESLAEMLVTHAERQLAEERRLALEAQLRQSQKMGVLGTLAGGIVHDFNNILGAIGMNAELALEKELASEVRQSLEDIFAAHSRASDLVKRILTFGRHQESARKPVALTPVVEEVLSLLRASIRRNVTLEMKSAPDVPIISADASQMHQVILNLATNAAHAIGERAGKLSIMIDRVEVDADNLPSAESKPGPYLRLTVTDTGTGMPPEIAERIFEPFFSTKGQGGTGLGLAVVHGIVREHDGVITVDSELGRGTTFRLLFPARDTEQAVTATKPRATRRCTSGRHP